MPDLHCWKDKGEWIEETYGRWSDEHIEHEQQRYQAYENDDVEHPGGTCMLPKGHDGPHVFTSDDDIVIDFGESE